MSHEQSEDRGEAAQPEGSVALAIARYQQGDGSELGEMMFAYYARLFFLASGSSRRGPRPPVEDRRRRGRARAMGSCWRAVKEGNIAA